MQTIALVGNPNSGKTTLFNALTGLRQKVGNYPGITVERKTGTFYGHHGEKFTLVDLPGAYSLSSKSPDESVTRECLMGLNKDLDHPDVLVLVVDASNLERHLYFATQVVELNIPCILALNMMDSAENKGLDINFSKLSSELGIPVVPMTASKAEGLTGLKVALSKIVPNADSHASIVSIPENLNQVIHQHLSKAIELNLCTEENSSLRLFYLAAQNDPENFGLNPDQLAFLKSLKAALTSVDAGWEDLLIGLRYERIAEIAEKAISHKTGGDEKPNLTDRIDKLLLHPLLGWGFLGGFLMLIFFLIFSFAQIPMGWIESLMAAISSQVIAMMPEGDFRDLIVDGILAGVEGVIIFLPQILILFFFIAIMEETGYMARVAFIMDRVMGKVGLNGKSFVPLLSSYACAVPGVMAARTIENPKDRLITILVVPLASCSARLPVYLLMIAAMIPEEQMSVALKIQVLLGLYFLGTFGAFFFAWLFRKTLSGGDVSPMVLELPPYKAPNAGSILVFLWDRAWIFIRRAGTIIMGLSILLWAAATYPKLPESDLVSGDGIANQSLALEYSVAGRLGKLIEPVVAPLGYDWKIGIGVLTSFAAREVFVSTMAIIYSVEEADDDALTRKKLRDRLAAEERDGKPLYTPLLCISLMVFYVFAMQCLSTVAVVKRETGGWKWPIFQIVYMTATAYILALIVYQGGQLLGFS